MGKNIDRNKMTNEEEDKELLERIEQLKNLLKEKKNFKTELLKYLERIAKALEKQSGN